MPTLKRYNGTDWEYIGLPSNVGMSPQTLGYAEVTANQAVTTEVDLTGLTVTVVVPEGRRLRITGHTLPSSSVASDEAEVYIYEGGTKLATAAGALGAVGGGSSVDPVAIVSPSAGAHTYKLRAARSVGTGTVQMNAGVGYSSFILVEDITGSTLPYQPASVPVGELTRYETGAGIVFTTGVDSPASINIAVPAGRVVALRAFGQCLASAASSWYVSVMEGAVEVGRLFTEVFAGADYSYMSGHCIISPSAGAHTYTLRATRFAGTGTLAWQSTPSLYFEALDITPTPAPSSGAPGSTLGYAEVTANQSPITTEVDVTGLSVTVTVPDGRRIRISSALGITSSVNDDIGFMRIAEGGTNLAFAQAKLNTNTESVFASIVLTPTAGSHTYKIRAARTSGTGNLTVGAASTNPAYILVEDITGSVWPEGSEVTAGMVASEPFGAWTPSFAQGNTPAQTVNWASYQKLGRLVIAHFNVTINAAGTINNNIILSGLPGAAANTSAIGGSFRYFDAGNTNRAGTITGATTTTAKFEYDGYGNSMGNADFIMANGDLVQGTLIYEAAS